MNNFTIKTFFFHIFINNITIFYIFVLCQSTYYDRIDYVKNMFMRFLYSQYSRPSVKTTTTYGRKVN